MTTPDKARLRGRALAFAIDILLLYTTLLPLLWLLHQCLPDLAGGWVDRLLKRSLPALAVLACWWGLEATPGQMLLMQRIVDAKSGAAMNPRQCLLRWLVFIASALPLGVGFLWVAIDPQRRPLHDSVSGTTVVRRPLPKGRRAPRGLREALVAHWRGERPLPLSFWQNTVLVLEPLLLLIVGLTVAVNVYGDLPRLGSAALLLLWPLTLVVATWSLVGTWRAVAEHERRGPARRWPMPAAQGALALIAAATLYACLVEFLPRAGGYVQLAVGNDPLGHAEITLADGGARVDVKGSLGVGDSARFERAAATPGLRAVEIESSGGRLAEAARIADLVREKKLGVRVTGPCRGACGLVFLAAEQRQLMPGGALGLSRPSAGILSPLMNAVLEPDLAGLYRQHGAPEAMLARLFAMAPGQAWEPSRDQLVDAEIVDPLPPTLDVALPALGSTPGDLVEALRDNPNWYWIEQRHPGTIEAAAARMDAVRRDPAQSDAQVLAAGQAVVSALLPELLQGLRNDLRADYVPIWRDELKAAREQGGDACTGVLSGDAAAKRQLPPDVLAAETAWLVRVAMAPDAQGTPRPINANEATVLSHRLGERAPGLLAGLYAATRERAGATGCARTIDILDAVATLPTNVREVAARALFQ